MCTSRPKVPAPTAVIERQPYKSPASRESLSSGSDPNMRRRRIAGVETSAQGITDPASTTRRVLAGGDTPMLTPMGGGGSSSSGAPIGGGGGLSTAPPASVSIPAALAQRLRVSGGRPRVTGARL